MLEALSPGLGWGVFRRYPEQFASPDAVESWRLLAAYLFTLGIPGEQVGGTSWGRGRGVLKMWPGGDAVAGSGAAAPEA